MVGLGLEGLFPAQMILYVHRHEVSLGDDAGSEQLSNSLLSPAQSQSVLMEQREEVFEKTIYIFHRLSATCAGGTDSRHGDGYRASTKTLPACGCWEHQLGGKCWSKVSYSLAREPEVVAGKVKNASVDYTGPDGKTVGDHAALQGCKTMFYIHKVTENLVQTCPTYSSQVYLSSLEVS